MATENPWDRQPGEPPEAYFVFRKYYLLLGPTRTLLQTYRTQLSLENPKKLNELAGKGNGVMVSPDKWTQWADKWEWRDRAMAWDEELLTEAGVVELARSELKNSAMLAVRALGVALTNPKTAVSAAKEILDRSGIPAIQQHDIRNVTFSADELAQAAQEVEEWEKDQDTSK